MSILMIRSKLNSNVIIEIIMIENQIIKIPWSNCNNFIDSDWKTDQSTSK